MYNRIVSEITVDRESGKATGVRLEDGSQISADVVIANADLSYVYTKLLPDKAGANWVSVGYEGGNALSYGHV